MNALDMFAHTVAATVMVVTAFSVFADLAQPPAGRAVAVPPLSAARWRWRRGYLIAVAALHVDLVALAVGMMVWQERLMAITAAAAVAGIGVAAALGTAAALEENDYRAVGWGVVSLMLLFFVFVAMPGWRETLC